MITKDQLPSPAVIVDLDIAQKNISRVIKSTQEAGINLRPHMKAHKTVYFAKKLIEAGACGVTAAKLSEAEVMVENGIDNILIAFPLFGREKWERFGNLNKKAEILTTVDSLEIAKGLNAVGTKEHPVHVLVEVDFGLHRCGIQPGHDFIQFALALKNLEGLKIDGVFTYNGLIYGSKTVDEIREFAKSEALLLKECAKQLKSIGIEAGILSGGNTPDILALDQLTGISEIRPGNFLYNDVSGLNLKTAYEEDCAIKIIATVVSTPVPGYATIDAGSKALTSDLAANAQGYGRIVGRPDVSIVKLNEEHGFLKHDPATRKFSVGDRLEIIPNHACVISNLCDFVYGIRGNMVEKEIKIEARGKNY